MITDQDNTVPIFEITEGWTVEDLKTEEECDEAHAVLTEQIASIEGQIFKANHDARAERKYANADWYRRVKAALKFKKAALQRTQTMRGNIKREEKQRVVQSRDRRLLDIIKGKYPEHYAECMAVLERKEMAAA